MKSVSRSGARPEPTVTVRMEENVRMPHPGKGWGMPFVIALGDVSVTKGDEK